MRDDGAAVPVEELVLAEVGPDRVPVPLGATVAPLRLNLAIVDAIEIVNAARACADRGVDGDLPAVAASNLSELKDEREVSGVGEGDLGDFVGWKGVGARGGDGEV